MQHITITHSSPAATDPFVELQLADAVVQPWATALVRAVVRCCRRPASGDDVAMRVVVGVLELTLAEQLDLIDQYPDPMVYARLVTGRALVDHDRTERIQQCRGARLFTDTDGTVQPGRTWAYGDAPVGNGSDSLFDLMVDAVDTADEVVDRLDTDRMLDLLLDGLDDDERWLLTRVDGLGQQVNEIAGEYGVVRETLSKRLSKIRARVQRNRERMEHGGVITSTDSPALATAGAAPLGRSV